MSNIPNLSTSRDEPLSITGTVGVDKERVDPYTLQVIDQLFPGHHGIQFLAGILRHASVKQLALPELAMPEVTDVAVITVQSIRILARLIGFSYDTTEKYIVILSQLGLLHKKRYRHQIILHFPLGRCQIPEPEALERLDYRPKVTSFAGQVKRRIVLLRTSRRIEPPPSSLTVVQGNVQRLAPQLIEDIRKILQQEVDSEMESRLLLKIEGAVRYRCTQSLSRLSEQEGDSEMITSGQQSRLFDAKGDSFVDGTHQERRLFGQKGDLKIGAPGQQGLLSEQEGDSEMMTSGQQSRLFDAKGDSFADGIHQERRLFGQKGDSVVGMGAYTVSESPFLEQKGDFQDHAVAASLNDNVIPIYNDSVKEEDDSDNDAAASARAHDYYSSGDAAKVGRQLATFLEKSPRNTGGFVNKCKQCSRTVIRASVIDTLVHSAFPLVDPADERGRPKNKASWFHDACKKYTKPGTRFPAFIEKWLRTDLAWDEIERQLNEAALRYNRSMIANSSTADLVRQWLRGEIEQQVLDAALPDIVPSSEQSPQGSQSSPELRTGTANGRPFAASMSPTSGEAAKTWMDEYEAEALADEIMRDENAKALGVSRATAKQEHGVFVVMVTCRGSSFPMKTPQQWRTHLERVQRSMALQQQQRRD